MSSLVSLQVFTASDFGEILHSRSPGKYSNLHSARVQAQKSLAKEVALGNLEKRQDFYCLPTYRGEHKEHSRLLTKHLVEILKVTDATIHREHSIDEVGLRPDALVMVRKGDKGLCIVLEVVHNETPDYLKQKVTTWKNWPKSTEYLSIVFNLHIPYFSIVTTGQYPDCINFDDFMKEIKQ